MRRGASRPSPNSPIRRRRFTAARRSQMSILSTEALHLRKSILCSQNSLSPIGWSPSSRRMVYAELNYGWVQTALCCSMTSALPTGGISEKIADDCFRPVAVGVTGNTAFAACLSDGTGILRLTDTAHDQFPQFFNVQKTLI